MASLKGLACVHARLLEQARGYLSHTTRAYEPAVGGRQSESGDHVVEGLHDSLVESCKDLLQMTARHDQLAKCGIVCFAR